MKILIGRSLIIVSAALLLIVSDETRAIVVTFAALYFLIVAITIFEKSFHGRVMLPERFRVVNIAIDWIWRGFKSG